MEYKGKSFLVFLSADGSCVLFGYAHFFSDPQEVEAAQPPPGEVLLHPRRKGPFRFLGSLKFRPPIMKEQHCRSAKCYEGERDQ